MDLLQIRAALARCLAALDQHLAGQAPGNSDGDPARFRVRPGGPLSEAGIAEIERRFAEGQADTTIALALGISVPGVARRRAMWRRTRAAQQGG